MSNKDYKIRIEADNSGAIRAFKETGEELKKMSGVSKREVNELGSVFDTTIGKITAFAAAAAAAYLTISTAKAALTRGADLDEIASAFTSVSGGAEKATENLNKFVAAADGLISKADLMKAGSKALLAGLDADTFAELTTLATQLSDAAGATDLGMLEQLSSVMASGREMAFKNIGVYTDMTEKVKEYAEAAGKSADAIDEETKRMIFKNEAMEALRQKAAELETGETNLRDELDRLATSFTDATDTALLFLVEITSLADGASTLAGVLNQVRAAMETWIPGTVAYDMAQTSAEIQKLEKQAESLNNRLNASIPIEKWIKGDKLEAELAKVNREIAAMEKHLMETSTANVKATESGQSLLKTHQQQKAEILELIKNGKTETEGRTKNAKAIKDQQKALDDLRKSQEQEARTVMQLVERTEDYKQILLQTRDGTIDQSQAADRLNDLYGNMYKLVRELSAAEIDLQASLIGVGKGADQSAEALAKVAQRVADLKEEIQGAVTKTSTTENPFADLTSSLEQAAAQGINEALTSILNGSTSSAQLGNIGASFGGQGGAALGKIYGGPIGGAIGQAIGSKLGKTLGDAIGGFFGSNNKGAKARDQIDAYFEDLLDANRISLIINGQLKLIDEMREESLFGSSMAYDPFIGLSDSAQSQFTSIGMAFENMFDVFGEIGGQWGNVLANNVGGSLNNLQLLFQGLGISQEQLMEQLENMWLNGELSSQDFLVAGAQIQNLYEQGIPGAVGATDQAFQNLIDSGGAGRQVMDALGDAAVEAGEKGITTLEGLKEDLIASGADAEKVQELFNALAKVGITSLEQLKDVGINASAQIGAELEKTGDFFSDINEELDSMEERYKALKDKEVNLTFNVKTNIDKNTSENKDLLSKGGYDYNMGASQ